MTRPTNEVELLLLESLKRLSGDFQLREQRLTEHYENSVRLFEEQSNALRQQSEAVTKRLDELTRRYKESEEIMQRVLKRLDDLNGAPNLKPAK